ncbi:Dps family protein [Parvicella tangerina]|uniref:Ferritin/DPS domain-containing protein n=1 Tax=Parvicella tangerina TaxID=2829795 RepID=A0A916JMM5_9FLAO|nr:ferritin-like domain-containing protein [Parvicella tangerina]CAG5081776.1 hypothetical protein CRYO30217_01725 [Parvicella tangerina]
MKNIVKNKEPFKQLGFGKLETAEIVKKLNKTLATYQVFYHKLQKFHWNVVGSDFFDIHDLTEDLYRNAIEEIDDIAERIRVFGQSPTSSMYSYLNDSLIEEAEEEKSGEYMVYEIINDLQVLAETFLDAHEYCTKNGDIGTAHMISQMIKNLETYHWQLTAWSNRKFA